MHKGKSHRASAYIAHIATFITHFYQNQGDYSLIYFKMSSFKVYHVLKTLKSCGKNKGGQRTSNRRWRNTSYKPKSCELLNLERPKLIYKIPTFCRTPVMKHRRRSGWGGLCEPKRVSDIFELLVLPSSLPFVILPSLLSFLHQSSPAFPLTIFSFHSVLNLK